jgi:hypothetical protein
MKKFKTVFLKKESGTPYNWASMSPSKIEEVYENAKATITNVSKVIVG